MPIEVKTKDGVKHTWSMFEHGGVTNRLNELSEALFDELHTRVTVIPSVDYRGIQEAIRQSGIYVYLYVYCTINYIILL